MTKLAESQFYLASQSPRRLEILTELGYDFSVIKLEVDETPLMHEDPKTYVMRVARAKAFAALAVRENKNLPILAADTTVTIRGEILGKPNDLQDAVRMLEALSGTEHEVHTAICMAKSDSEFAEVLSSSIIEFAHLSSNDIQNYCKTREPMDKAGAYAIQGYAAAFIKHMQGSPSGVRGLPIYETVKLLKEFGIGLFND